MHFLVAHICWTLFICIMKGSMRAFVRVKWGWLFLVWGWLFASVGSAESPIIGYTREHRPSKKEFHSAYLKHIKTLDVLPLLRSLCADCQWVTNHASQMVGLFCSNEKWGQYRSAIIAMDKKPIMVGLEVDVIEISHIRAKRYQQLLSHLTAPVKLNDTIDGLIQLLISQGDAKIVSSPRLIGRSGKPMILKVGDKVPYKTSVQNASGIQTNTQYIQSGIQLNVTPYLHYSQLIDLDIEVSYNAVNGYRTADGLEMPIIASRMSNVNIQVSANRTIVFAGLLDKSQHETIEKVPFIGDVPWIGRLFQRNISNERTTDLVYKIRPFIVE